MFKRIFFGALGLAFLAAPVFASADSACPALSGTLARGSRGDDVSQLQQFLIAQGSLQSGAATGYFGAMTEESVKLWQSKNGLDSVGIVGPKTRAAIAGICRNAAVVKPSTLTFTVIASSTQNVSFAASPTSGTAPLTVHFTGRGGMHPYLIDFGDGTARRVCIQGGNGECNIHVGSDKNSLILAPHEYTSAGTYTALLLYGGCGSASCDASMKPTPVAEVTITVR